MDQVGIGFPGGVKGPGLKDTWTLKVSTEAASVQMKNRTWFRGQSSSGQADEEEVEEEEVLSPLLLLQTVQVRLRRERFTCSGAGSLALIYIEKRGEGGLDPQGAQRHLLTEVHRGTDPPPAGCRGSWCWVSGVMVSGVRVSGIGRRSPSVPEAPAPL
ncbi:hypothetical protein EYF80_020198 [Liparis tanakae]|uniref:Uncharacterized protein n=1 Tax=Liparis tanakae TaxID=230148 RepID=A0A4Z2HX33_9TELE|nr:hypothetical protein EYF80_020198 [Liparis tanakae]